jgi:hypothetical protein
MFEYHLIDLHGIILWCKCHQRGWCGGPNFFRNGDGSQRFSNVVQKTYRHIKQLGQWIDSTL